MNIGNFITKYKGNLKLTNHFRSAMLPYIEYKDNVAVVKKTPNIEAINKISFKVK